jgi:hypothetical protein
MPALLDNSAFIEHQNSGRLAYRQQVVGHDDAGAPASEPEERLHDSLAGFRIKPGGWFIQQQDWRTTHHCSGNSDALALPTGESASALANPPLIIGKRVDRP